jgi:thiol:disulfide interchange protein DsbA
MKSMTRHNILWLLTLLCFPLLTVNAQELYKEGVHYELLPEPVATSTDDKIEVVELFWYGCPHCFKLEPQVESWLKNKPENVEFVRIPAVLGRHWEIGARAYYTAEELGILEQTHQAMFDAIHVQNRPMADEQQLAEFFAEHGVDQAAFEKAFKSFNVQAKFSRAQELVRRYRIRGVPSLIVNGKYKASSFDVVDYLISKENDSS